MGVVKSLGWIAGFGCLILCSGLPACDGDDTTPSDGGEVDAPVDGDGEATEEADAEAEAEADGEADGEAGPTRRLTIFHTNDTHSHLMGTGPELEVSPGTTGDDPTLGGMARLATLLAERRAAAEAAGNDVLVTDGGDFMMGTPFEILDRDAAPALMMFRHLGYDLLTLGNHEFEWGPDHLAATIEAAGGLGFDIPIVSSNMVTSGTDARDDRLEALVTDGTIVPETTVALPGGLVVGVLGWMGEAAASVAPAKAPVTFGEAPSELQPRAAALKAGGANLVVLLSHTGPLAGGSGRDQAIAAAAPDVDIILGGHSHDALTDVLMAGDTMILQAGSYARYLAELTVDVSDAGVALVDYRLHPIDDSIAGDTATQELIDGWIDALDAGPLAAGGLAYYQPIAETAFDVTTPGMAESNLGDLVTDAYREAAAAATPSDPVVAAFESDGVIRDDLLAGDDGVLCFADVFRVLPLGVGPDMRPGYPLVSFWVDGAELRDACEVTVSVPGIAGGDYIIQMSGMRCHRNPSGGLMTLIDGVYLGNDVDGYSPTSIDITGTDPTLYRITVDLYVASLMSVLSEMTYGLLEITPKQSDGTPVTDMAAMILDVDPATAGVQELKLWEALLAALSTFPDDDGDTLPEVPARYATPADRYYD